MAGSLFIARADRTRQITLDGPVPIGDGTVAYRLQTRVYLGHLLRLEMLRHQRLDDRGDGQAADRVPASRRPAVTPADFTVDMQL
jgi:hypothetical protein